MLTSKFTRPVAKNFSRFHSSFKNKPYQNSLSTSLFHLTPSHINSFQDDLKIQNFLENPSKYIHPDLQNVTYQNQKWTNDFFVPFLKNKVSCYEFRSRGHDTVKEDTNALLFTEQYILQHSYPKPLKEFFLRLVRVNLSYTKDRHHFLTTHVQRPIPEDLPRIRLQYYHGLHELDDIIQFLFANTKTNDCILSKSFLNFELKHFTRRLFFMGSSQLLARASFQNDLMISLEKKTDDSKYIAQKLQVDINNPHVFEKALTFPLRYNDYKVNKWLLDYFHGTSFQDEIKNKLKLSPNLSMALTDIDKLFQNCHFNSNEVIGDLNFQKKVHSDFQYLLSNPIEFQDCHVGFYVTTLPQGTNVTIFSAGFDRPAILFLSKEEKTFRLPFLKPWPSNWSIFAESL